MQFRLPSRLHAILQTDLVIRLICAAWLISKLLSYNLWMAYRLFPLVPVHPVLSGVPVPVHTLLFVLGMFCLAVLVVMPGKKLAQVLLLLELLSCLLDQNRWQPWEFAFLSLLAAYVFVAGEKMLRFCWQLVLVGSCFYSGMSLFSSSFIHSIWEPVILRHFLGFRNAGPWLIRAGYGLPLLEMAAAGALCFGFTRKPAVWVLAGLHVLNLILFGPIGLNLYSVTWPWNILMPFLLFLLFYKDGLILNNRQLWQPGFAKVLLLLWWILPALQPLGIWDKDLTASGYSSANENMFVCTDDLLASLQLGPYFIQSPNITPCKVSLSVYKWSMSEMNVPPYPQQRVFKAIAREWNKRYPEPSNKFYLYLAGFGNRGREMLP